jgi:geranylgeranyl pyrophosphate synthase
MVQAMLQDMPDEVLNTLAKLVFELDHSRASTAASELLNRSVLSGGKRLRPLLTLLFGQMVGASKTALEICAVSIEQVHGASLAHDDVIDGAQLRRSKPSINVLGTNKKAVLAGDILLAQVIINLSTLNHPALLQEMAVIIKDLALGEWIQWDVIHERKINAARIEDIAVKKTSSIMSWCACAPLHLIDADEKTLVAGREFGYHLGLAFQLIDDTLDDLSSSQKDQNLDIENEQVNAVVFEWFQSHQDALLKWEQGISLGEILQGADLSQARNIVQSRAWEHLEKSEHLLENIASQIPKSCLQSKNSIKQLLNFLKARES